MELQTIVFMGRSGCGKGTQVKELTKHLEKADGRNVFHLEAGDRFREFISGDKYSNILAYKIYQRGGLQPEFLSVWAWTDKLVREFGEETHLLIDGTPRRLSEAKVLESVFDFFTRSNVNIVYIDVSREWAIERMKGRGRIDDRKMEDVIARLDWFDSDVIPVVDYYKSHEKHKFHHINGEQSVEKVFLDILKSLQL